MDMEKIIRDIIHKSIKSMPILEDLLIEIEIPRERNFGDMSTPIAMNLSKKLRKPPQKIAEEIVSSVKSDERSSKIFDNISIAGPGFINFTFSKKYLCDELRELLKKEKDFLIEDIGKGKRVQIEFVSANPTGPLHLGHGRGAALGEALSNLLKDAGYKVEKEYYINDAGRQLKLLGLSVLVKYKHLSGIDYPYPEDGYKGEYIEDIAKEFKDIGIEFKDDNELLEKITDFAYKKMLDEIKRDLSDFGISFDSWQSERELYKNNEVVKAIDELKNLGYIYEKDEAYWFKSTEFGDDKDRVVIKKDGEYTYFAPDIAYHKKKIEKGFDEIIDIWGADHHGYIPRMQGVIQALGYPKEYLRILLVQLVTLLRGGKPVQMSKRAGEFITLREVIDELGADTTKFLFLTRRPDSHLEVDIEVARAQSHENPVFYVQYAYARINSIFQKTAEQNIISSTDGLIDFNCELLNSEEMQIIKKVLTYPMVFKNAALAREPHRITFYLQELAGMFHPYYQKYRIITDDNELTRTRLALCQGIRTVLMHGLKILGVNAPERM